MAIEVLDPTTSRFLVFALGDLLGSAIVTSSVLLIARDIVFVCSLVLCQRVVVIERFNRPALMSDMISTKT